MNEAREICPQCGGEGGFRVTHEMAMDADDCSMSGMFWGCNTCNGDGWILVEGEPSTTLGSEQKGEL